MPPLLSDKPMTNAERMRRYRERHGDRAKQLQREWVVANRERVRESSRAHYARNASASKERTVAWREANRDEARRHSRRSYYQNREKRLLQMASRRARGKEFTISEKDRRSLFRQDCFVCGAAGEHVDHIIPISRGGRHSIGNLQMLCQRCNLSKNSKLMVEWRRHCALAA